MLSQVLGSIAVGLGVSAILFVPLVIWQYRRFGRFDGVRMLWTVAAFIYASAVVAFTIFPLPNFTAEYCATRNVPVGLDPLRPVRELGEVIAADGVVAGLRSFVLWEVLLNVALFVPFGFIVRRMLEWRPVVVLLAALATSVLIEVAQYTANFGLSPCAYRVSDVTDLIANTTGAAVGLALAAVTPRLLSRKDYLLARRDDARPVTVARRLTGMALDAWLLSVVAFVGGTLGAVAFLVPPALAGTPVTAEGTLGMERWLMAGAGTLGLLVVVIPALVGSGASLGQRIVFLAPVAPDGSRARLVARALVVQGAVVALPMLDGSGVLWLLTSVWAMVAAASVLRDVRGLSCGITGCHMVDARAGAELAPSPTPVAHVR